MTRDDLVFKIIEKLDEGIKFFWRIEKSLRQKKKYNKDIQNTNKCIKHIKEQ